MSLTAPSIDSWMPEGCSWGGGDTKQLMLCRIAVTAKHNNEDIDDAVAALKTAHETVLGAA